MVGQQKNGEKKDNNTAWNHCNTPLWDLPVHPKIIIIDIPVPDSKNTSILHFMCNAQPFQTFININYLSFCFSCFQNGDSDQTSEMLASFVDSYPDSDDQGKS